MELKPQLGPQLGPQLDPQHKTMTEIEKQIIQLVQQNKHFSGELKKQYILSMFLMEEKKQEEYLRLLQAFTHRCHEMDRGVFVVRPEESKRIMRTYEQVKEDLIKKLSTNNPNK